MRLRSCILKLLGLSDPESPVVQRLRNLRRRLAGTDALLARAYLETEKTPKLHVGGGPRLLEGWLNADLSAPPGVLQMDATQPFPFPGGTFTYLFTEHMIEHVPYDGGMAMLRECHRVLQPGGTIRVVTPDLTSLAALCGPQLNDLQKRYLEWFCAACVPAGRRATPAEALNANFRLWGHQFIYDEESLKAALLKAGFSDVRRCALMESPHAALRNLENVDRYPEGFLELESLALEARK